MTPASSLTIRRCDKISDALHSRIQLGCNLLVEPPPRIGAQFRLTHLADVKGNPRSGDESRFVDPARLAEVVLSSFEALRMQQFAIHVDHVRLARQRSDPYALAVERDDQLIALDRLLAMRAASRLILHSGADGTPWAALPQSNLTT